MEPADIWLQGEEKLLLIDGRLVPSRDGGRREIVEPATGRPLAVVTGCGAVDALQALGAARRAADDGPWPRMGAAGRAQRMLDLAQRIESDAELLARVEARDSGRALRETAKDVRYAAALLQRETQGAAADQGRWRTVDGGLETVTQPAPLGVIVAAAGAHAPLRSAVSALAPALAAGNAVIIVPDVRTSLSVMRLGEMALRAGFPPGALQVLSGGREAASALVAEDAVDLLLEDSGVGGEEWLRAARGARPIRTAPRAKGTLLVLSGADPVIAAEHSLVGATYGQGALPGGVQRIVAERKAHDHLVLQLISRASALTLGSPIDPDCEVGPLVSEGQREAVETAIADARAEGATLVSGGQRGQGARLDGGFFLQPSVLVGLRPSMQVWNKDVPGPVLLVHEAEDLEEAMRALGAAGPVGVFGAHGRGLGRLGADLPKRDILLDTWNLPQILTDPGLCTWRREDLSLARNVWRAEPEGPGWYFSS